MKYINIFLQELKKHNLNWCLGECGTKGHKRGFVLLRDKSTVHLNSNISTRSSLHRGLHEIGHCINDEKRLRSYEKEAKAEEFATKLMRNLGIPIPKKVSIKGKAYVQRKKLHGDNIKKALGGKNE
jgi:hypothetical protein